jgi:hypothetical protein
VKPLTQSASIPAVLELDSASRTKRAEGYKDVRLPIAAYKQDERHRADALETLNHDRAAYRQFFLLAWCAGCAGRITGARTGAIATVPPEDFPHRSSQQVLPVAALFGEELLAAHSHWQSPSTKWEPPKKMTEIDAQDTARRGSTFITGVLAEALGLLVYR